MCRRSGHPEKNLALGTLLPAFFWAAQGASFAFPGAEGFEDGTWQDALEVIYGTAGVRPSTTVVREVWKQRHGGYRAAPLLVVVAYPEEHPNEAMVCGPAGDNPTVVDLDLSRAERLGRARRSALGEPQRHLAIRFLAEALEGGSDAHPGLRNKGLLATHELLYGVPRRADREEATARSELLSERGQDLVEKLGYEIETRARHRRGGDSSLFE